MELQGLADAVPPAAIERPPLAVWLFERDLDWGDLAKVLNKTRQAVRFYLLPFGDPKRRIPSEGDIAAIFAWTAGAITAADHYPSRLNGHAQ